MRAPPEYVAKSHRLLLVRPTWASAKASSEALGKARAFVGKGYDFLGLIGLNVPEHYRGRILYDSGNP